MRARLSAWLGEGAFWAFTLGLPLQALLQLPGAAPQQAPRPPGLATLALPAALAGPADPLAGWQALDPPPPASQPAPAASASEISTTPADPAAPPPVQLYGELMEGRSKLYCFLDTRTRRWFRLSPGAADAAAGVRLTGGGAEGPAVLLDLASGRRYALVHGRRQLVPLADEVPVNEPD